MLWCCVTPERQFKTHRIMNYVRAGWAPAARIVVGEPPQGNDPFIVWGQAWLAERIIPSAIEHGRPCWQLDNGFWKPARGGTEGYYRVSYRGLFSILLENASAKRARDICAPMMPWRSEGKHVVVAIPGQHFGRMVGLDMPGWTEKIVDRVKKCTDRPVIVRAKDDSAPLSSSLADAWALVTHSSNVAVDAVRAGVPVFVEPTSPAAPVGNLDLANMEHPRMPDRDDWLASLACQQFTLEEMRSGVARRFMTAIAAQVDRQT